MTRRTITVALGAIATALIGVGVLGGCTSDGDKSKPSGEQIAAERQNVQLKNDVEGKNYNGRLVLADNPATLIWCTIYPTSPNAKAFTVPIVGKLTSGNKRPYSTSRLRIDTDTPGQEYSPEVAGPDGMYGTSGEYRYGFDPAGNYHDFYNLETYCTSVPTVIQKETTQIAISNPNQNLAVLDRRVQDALAACQRAQGKNVDHTKPCAEAAAILGVS